MSIISRRGNRHLRKVIYNMTFCVVRYAGPFRDYFFKRKREGLPFRKALLASAHKPIRTIFAILNNKTLYKVEVAQKIKNRWTTSGEFMITFGVNDYRAKLCAVRQHDAVHTSIDFT